jgi:tRNA1(Val) A37 N6-methylase TrmN6
MRYVINTNDAEGLIGIQLAKLQKEGKLTIIEKSETFVEIEKSLQKVASALEILKKVGYNSEVMIIYLNKKTGASMKELESIMYYQKEYLKSVGALK